MYSKEMFLKSEKISKKIKKCNYWWHFCLVYLVYLCQFCLVPLFVISVQSSDSSFVHKTGLIFLVGSFYIVSDQYSTDFRNIIIIMIFSYSPKHCFRLIEGQQYHCWSEKSPAMGLKPPTLGIQGRRLHHSSTEPLYVATSKLKTLCLSSKMSCQFPCQRLFS